MQKLGSLLVIIWSVWLLVEGVFVAGIAFRQWQLWRRAERGARLPALLQALLMTGWSLGGFTWIVALTLLGEVKLPRSYVVTMMIARSFGSISVWLWGGMLLGAIRERSGPGFVKRWRAGLRSWASRHTAETSIAGKWLAKRKTAPEPPRVVSGSSGDQNIEDWKRWIGEIVESGNVELLVQIRRLLREELDREMVE